MEIKIVNNIEDIYSIMVEFDKEFTHRSNCSDAELRDYSNKVFNNAVTIAISDDKNVLGFASFYCNDKDAKVAFLSKIAVKKSNSNKGFGTLLLKECEAISKANGMKKLRLEVYNDNSNAIEFYKKNSYVVEKDCTDNSVFMIKDL